MTESLTLCERGSCSSRIFWLLGPAPNDACAMKAGCRRFAEGICTLISDFDLETDCPVATAIANDAKNRSEEAGELDAS